MEIKKVVVCSNPLKQFSLKTASCVFGISTIIGG
jgi:hypothetical protein